MHGLQVSNTLARAAYRFQTLAVCRLAGFKHLRYALLVGFGRISTSMQDLKVLHTFGMHGRRGLLGMGRL